MLGWIVRIVMSLAGVITGWFLAENATSFSVVQMVIAILLIAFFVGVAAFWETLSAWVKGSGEAQ
jgi:hypothetical protein